MVTALGNLGGFSAQLTQPRFHARRKIVDLDTGIVIVEFARHLPAGELEQRRYCIAERCLSPVSDVQRAGRVGGNEFDVDYASGADRVAAEFLVGSDDVAKPGRNSPGIDPEIHEAGAGNFNFRDAGALQLHRIAQPFRDLARFGPQRFGKNHRQICRPISVRRFPRALQEWVDILRRANAARRANQLGADLLSGRHSPLFDLREAAGLSPGLGVAVFASLAGLASVGFASGSAVDSVFPPSSPPLAAPSPAGAVCGFLPSLP